MTDYVLSVILGTIEGVTEFLPVSSTAHLRISQALMHINLADGYWKMYTVVIQLGAVLCLPVYFAQRLKDFAATFPKGERGDRGLLTHPLGLTLVAFLVTAGPSWLLTKVIGKHLESVTIIGASLLIGGIVMWVVDAMSADANAHSATAAPARTVSLERMSLGQAIWIGACQILSAVFPGTSRSMSTIAAGQVAGMSRSAALEFSFLLSIPTMLVASGYDLLKSLKGDPANPLGVMHVDQHGWMVLAVGFVVAFGLAYLSVGWMVGFVRRRGFRPFAIYRIAIGTLILLFASPLVA